MNKKENISKILKALSHPDRLDIVINLYHNECSVSKCQKRMKLPQSTISQHLKTIMEAGITERRREGTTVCYKVVNKFVIELIKIIEK
ncbi:MAG: metalloregulator ArsR/SmtB family transcription factor [Candidatus Marinimicrobia bacterium]|nr:metalloregulator ArsR/SmtB family transcription factor [Candidatus Neomarinimicrobiota bacterium]